MHRRIGGIWDIIAAIYQISQETPPLKNSKTLPLTKKKNLLIPFQANLSHVYFSPQLGRE